VDRLRKKIGCGSSVKKRNVVSRRVWPGGGPYRRHRPRTYRTRPVWKIVEKGTMIVDELIQQVSKKTGLSPEMAKMAVDTVLGYLKEKLPAPIAGQIDGVLGGSGGTQGIGNLTKGLGGLLSKK
jgi:hypothetical protein